MDQEMVNKKVFFENLVDCLNKLLKQGYIIKGKDQIVNIDSFYFNEEEGFCYKIVMPLSICLFNLKAIEKLKLLEFKRHIQSNFIFIPPSNHFICKFDIDNNIYLEEE